MVHLPARFLATAVLASVALAEAFDHASSLSVAVWADATEAEVAVLGTPSTMSDVVAVLGTNTAAVEAYASSIGSIVTEYAGYATQDGGATVTEVIAAVAVTASLPLPAATTEAAAKSDETSGAGGHAPAPVALAGAALGAVAGAMMLA